MSLTVPDALLDQARRGPIGDAEFVACIRDSLPYAWSVVEGLAAELQETGNRSVQSTEVPPDEQAWGQLFRMVGSDAMRAAVQGHFGVRMAFQNCCKVGLFRPGADAEFEAFTSARAQILNQNPTLLNC